MVIREASSDDKAGVLIPPWCGVMTVSVAVFCIYVPFEALQNLQSSLHHHHDDNNNINNVGSISLGIIYATIIFTCVFSLAVIYALGSKPAMAFSFLMHLGYVISNFYPVPALLFPVSVALGSGMSLLFPNFSLYLNVVTTSYMRLHDLGPERTHGVLSMFTGIFYFFFKATHVAGNLISSLILSGSRYDMDAVKGNVCGASVCPRDSGVAGNGNDDVGGYSSIDDYGYANYNSSTAISNSSSSSSNSSISSSSSGNIVIVSPEKQSLYNLLFVFTAFDVLGLLILVFGVPTYRFSDLKADPAYGSQFKPARSGLKTSDGSEKKEEKDKEKEKEKEKGSVRSVIETNMASMTRIVKDVRFLLLVPFYLGQAMLIMIMYTSYNQAFVSCTIGVQSVGYVMLCLGLSGAVASFVVNCLAKYTGRIPLFVTTFTIDIGCLITLLLWQPDYNTSKITFFILPTIAGASEGIFQPQQIALASSIFGDQKAAAFASVSACRSIAFSITLFTLSTVCLYIQFTIALVFYVLGFCTYVVTEVREYRQRQKELSPLKPDVQPINPEVASKEKNGVLYGSVPLLLQPSTPGNN